MSGERHGTRRGYDRHRGRGEEPCEACRAVYERGRDAYRPEATLRSRARARAYETLKERHAGEWPALYAAKHARLEGVPSRIAHQRARNHAKQELARRYPTEFLVVYVAHLGKVRREEAEA